MRYVSRETENLRELILFQSFFKGSHHGTDNCVPPTPLAEQLILCVSSVGKVAVLND